MKLEPYLIRWQDSCSTPRWRTMEEYKEIVEYLPEITTVGFLFHTTDNTVTLIQSIDDKESDGEQLAMESITIPLGCILEIRKLK